MLPPTPIRRLLLVPLVVVIAGALAALRRQGRPLPPALEGR